MFDIESVPSEKRSRFSLKNRLAFFLFFATVLLYANTFQNGYVLDDEAVIVRNSIVTKGASAISEIFFTPYLHGYINNSNDLYRPLSLAMFAVEYQLFGVSPYGSHVVNVLVYALCVLALFYFLDALFDRNHTIMAFVASLLFALHPIHTEVVANIKSRDELLCFLFAFISLLSFLRYRASGSQFFLLAGGCTYLLSLLSKETSISFAVVVPFIFYFFKPGDKKKNRRIMLLALLAIGAFMALRTIVLNHFHANHPFDVRITENSLAGAPLSLRTSTAIEILGMYLKQLIIPYPLISDYSYNSIPLSSFGSFKVIISLVAYVVLIAIAVLRFRQDGRNPAAFAIFFYLITLALFSNLFFLVGATMAERFLFFPSVGFCLLLSLFFYNINAEYLQSKKTVQRKILFFAFGLMGLCYVLISLARNTDWKTSESLYRADIRRSPSSYRLHYYLGTELVNSGMAAGGDTATGFANLREGIGYLKRSISIYSAFPVVYAEVGDAYMTLGQYDSAARYNEQAIQLDPKDTFSMNKLAGAYFKMGRYRESIRECEKILSIDSNHVRSYRNIGAGYMRLQKYDSAISVLRTAINLDPDYPGPYGFMAIAYHQLGNYDSSKKYESLAQQFNPDFRAQ